MFDIYCDCREPLNCITFIENCCRNLNGWNRKMSGYSRMYSLLLLNLCYLLTDS